MGFRPFVVLLAPFVFCGGVQAQTACPAANRLRFDFSTQPAATLSYTGSYNYTATSTGGATQPFTLRFATNGVSSSMVAGTQLPAISDMINNGSGRSLVLGGIFNNRTANIFSNTRTLRAIFTFPVPIREFTMTAQDVDFAANQYRDWIAISGTNGVASYTPVMTTPFGMANGPAGTHGSTSSSLRLGADTTPYAIDIAAAVGVAASDPNATTGDVTMVFAQPVTQIVLRYGNYPYSSGENTTGQQAFGIDGISFCPMPVISVAKTSAPYVTVAGDPNRFNIPQADVAYMLTVTNAGGSTVDLASTNLADILPAGVSFFNGDYNGAAAGTTNFEFAPGASGLTLGAANVTYSNNNGSTYTYTPAAGYDGNVDAVRFVPQGTMAANSSFTIRFRARIN